jgi:hypothetical protein
VELRRIENIPDIDYMNSIIFTFSGGLADEVAQLMFAIDNKDKINKNTKIYFSFDYPGRYKDIEVCKYFNVKKYIDYEIVNIPQNVIKLYNDADLYNYVYKNFAYGLMEDSLQSGKSNNFMCFKPPFIYKLDGSYHRYKNLKDLLTLQQPLNEANQAKLEQIKSCKHSVCIHIRMGDVLRPTLHTGYLPKPNYFIDSIKQLKAKLNTEDINYFVFCNSMEVAKNRLLKEDLIQKIKIDFVDNNKDSEAAFELELMKSCKHFILSGGRFSDLAVSLSEYKDKIVLRPVKEDFSVNKESDWHYDFTNHCV